MAKNKKNILLALATTSAGTQNITKKIIEEIDTYKEDYILIIGDHIFKKSFTNNSKILRIKYVRFWIIRFLFEFLILPYYIKKYNAEQVLSLANFLLTPKSKKIKKTVIIRHPYLLEKDLSFLPFKYRIKEKFRQKIFSITLKNTDLLICQTNYMKQLYLNSDYKKIEVKVIPNPLSKTLTKPEKVKSNYITNTFIYPSRYYKHKNHELILKFVKEKREFCKQNGVKFILTIDKKILVPSDEEYDFIDFIGEIDQKKLNNYYDKVLAVIFTSNLETFGNGLIEAAYKRLPVVVPNLPYAKAILEDSGYYYEQNDLVSLQREISKIISNKPVPKYKIHFLIGTENWIEAIVGKSY